VSGPVLVACSHGTADPAGTGVRPGDAVVLAAAGSSDDAADRSVRAAAQRLGRAWGAPTSVAYGAARGPRLVSYLLATGHFRRRVLDAGADVVTTPLLDDGEPDERLVDLVVDRFGTAARRTLTA
jgi:hypothetical protein